MRSTHRRNEARRAIGPSAAQRTRRYKAFIERLRRTRVDAGLAQVESALLHGRPQTWVSMCDLGERRVDFVELEDWAAACGKGLEFSRTRGRRTRGRA